MKIKSVVSMLMLFASPAAIAQTSVPPAGDNAAEGLGDIVVTATKKARAEQLQRVPIAITAFDTAKIENTFATTITDIGRQAPNVRLDPVGTAPGTANFAIRGMGINTSIPSDEPTVGIIVDGVYLASNYGAMVDAFDLESLEILRGPQGTLFGRNVTAGAVNIRTKRPTGDTHLNAVLNAGNGGRADMSVAVDTPLTSDLAARVSVSYHSLDGFFTNRANGHKIDSLSDLDVRPTLQWKPNGGGTTVTLLGQYSRYRDGGSILRLLPTPGVGLQAGGYVPPSPNSTTLDHDTIGETNIDIKGATLEIAHEIGNGVLTSITGLREVKYNTLTDLDGASIPVLRLYTNVRQRQISEELRYAATAFDDKLDYTVGIYAFGQDLYAGVTVFNQARPTGSSASEGKLKEVSLSAFGQVEYHLSDQFSLIGGLRANYDRKSIDLGYGLRLPTQAGTCDPALLPVVSCTTKFEGAKSWTDISPRAGLSYRPARDTLLFASFTRGFRSGGYNIRNFAVLSPPGPYSPEKVDALEAGLKQEFLNGRLRTNLTGFYNKYSGLQRTVLNPNAISTVLNAANARMWGLEFEGAVVPFRGLRIDGTAGYTNARYESFNGLDLTGDGVADPALAKQLQLERAPKWTWSIGGTWDVYSGSLGKVSANTNYSYTGRTTANVQNTFFLPAYKLLDASVSYTTPDKHMTVSLYGKNLTDEIYGTTGSFLAGIGQGVYYSPPRSYGVEARFNF